LISSIPLEEKIESIYTLDLCYLQDKYDTDIQKIEQFTNNHSDALITFIIPTINRNTLYRSILSILNQTITSWKIIVLFDGCETDDPLLIGLLDNTRILSLSVKKCGKEMNERGSHGSAGEVRNIGMKLVTTPWIGFVDDDDHLDTKYIENLLLEMNETNNVDVVLFRMIQDYSIIPSISCRELKEGEVGISFAVRTSLVRSGFLFQQSRIEDLTFIKQLENHHKKIVISPFISYYVQKSTNISIRNLKRIQFN
jgi:glycosyltransferase involved in cell wall biosynthesis